ncbi:hypothetical protein BP5796_09838 [Coleophoma crateriformis]|uniref:Zn(2)-C6 fungal-type domain-containing protein n=1 Tax=Coleophoma crateriformis TaxID=565419 RepID=A0A3D8QTI7_9HELO|nr:hypothetical protein BP5796_09838 [Coleophoma crateriformis]
MSDSGNGNHVSSLADMNPRYKRGYQACDNCKARKIKCDIGPVDSPGKPPCRRCRRENRTCTFKSPTKRRGGGIQQRHADSVLMNDNLQQLDVHGVRDIAVVDGHRPGGSFNTALASPLSSAADPCLPPETNQQNTATLLKRPSTTSYDAVSILYGARRYGESRAGVSIDNVLRDSRSLVEKDNSELSSWSDFYFVHIGLLSASETQALFQYFRDRLLPFSPVAEAVVNQHFSPRRFLEEEPILAMTILVIASRYMPLEGTGSSLRSQTIHNALWERLKAMIDHMIWGQENFYGPFCGAIWQQAGESRPLSDSAHLMCPPLGGLRTLGACEALMLLTEWAPRAVYFPSMENQYSIFMGGAEGSKSRPLTTAIGNRSRLQELDPIWRSDRMVWSMLGNALTLAVELGVFDDADGPTMGTREARWNVWKDRAYQERATRIKHLLLAYLDQVSIRLGRSYLTPYSISTLPVDTDDDTVKCWVKITSLMRHVNKTLFRSQAYTTAIIESGEYLGKVANAQQTLKDWQKELNMARLSKSMRSIVTIEYHSICVSVSSVAITALTGHYEKISRYSSCDEELRAGMLSVYGENEAYIREGVSAAAAALRVVTDELSVDGTLTYIPDRVYLRILNNAIALWKALVLPIPCEAASEKLNILEQTVKALRGSVVDDIHLANRMAESMDMMINYFLRKRPSGRHRMEEEQQHADTSRRSRHSDRMSRLNQHPRPGEGSNNFHQGPYLPTPHTLSSEGSTVSRERPDEFNDSSRDSNYPLVVDEYDFIVAAESNNWNWAGEIDMYNILSGSFLGFEQQEGGSSIPLI